MAYGLIGDGIDTFGPTIQGMRLLREAVSGQVSNYPELFNFVASGESNNPEELARECFSLKNTIKDENLASTLTNLSLSASRCKEKLSLC